MAGRRSPREYFGSIKDQIDQKMALEEAAKSGDPEAALKLAWPAPGRCTRMRPVRVSWPARRSC